MTWHFRSRLSVPTVFALLLTAACDSSDDTKITISAPTKGQVLTLTDDLDQTKPGLQYDVKATATDIGAGGDALLSISDQTETSQTTVAKDGSITFEHATLPPGKHTLQITSGSAKSASDYDYTFKAIVIDSPKDGAPLGALDDTDATADGIQIAVTATEYAIDDTNDEVHLQVDDESVGDAVTPMTGGKLLFSGVTLSTGTHKLKIVAGSVESNEVTVSVNSGCANVTFVKPEPPAAGDRLTLGGGDMCPTGDDPTFKIDVWISTNAGENRGVDLKVNDEMVAHGVVTDTLVKFSGITLDHFKSANKLSVLVESAQGVTCDEVVYPSEIWVDCKGSDCQLSGPNVYSGTSSAGDSTYYLNQTSKSGDGFDITVKTDSDVLGIPVKLFIDEKETGAPTAVATQDGDNVSATFSGTTLSEGAHSIQAQCTDSAGNVTESAKAAWTVDTQECAVSVTTPTANTQFVPDDDVDSKTGGTQVAVASKVTGNDCASAAGAPCTPADGIQNASYANYNGKSPLTKNVTLLSQEQQTLCIEVKDRAGNIGRGSVDVRYLSSKPTLVIESPADGAKYNSTGGNGYTQDTDTSSSALCNADFKVACTDLSQPVKLHRDDANGALIGSASCVKPANGDPALPTGYSGRATITDAAFLDSGSDTATIVATQSEAGASGQLTGSSTPITITGDCQKPVLSFSTDPCNGGQIAVANAQTTAPAQDIVVVDSSRDTQSATLTVHNDDGTMITQMASISGNSYTFPAVSLGGPGTGLSAATVSVTTQDDFGNVSTLDCNTNIVFDLPSFAVDVAPASGALQPDCTPTGGGLGVSLTATADSATNRSAQVTVNAGTPIPLTQTGAAFALCVPVDAGSDTLLVELKSTRTNAVVSQGRMLSIVNGTPTAGGITLSTATLPSASDTNYRDGKVSLGWTAPTADYTGQFTAYYLRCSNQTVSGSAAIGDQADWWNKARVVALPTDFKPPSAAVDVNFRTGENNYCVLRAGDALNNLTPVTDSKQIQVKFREAHFTPPVSNRIAGNDAVDVGDVNGDGNDDLLVGGVGSAYLVFGSTSVWSSQTPSVTFSAETPDASTASFFGIQVAALGDFNGDGRSDFALAAPLWTGASSDSGRVLVFYGRASGDDWPTTPLDVTGSCAADVCFEDNVTADFFGQAVASAGDFNGDGKPDLAVGAYGVNSTQGRLYVILGKAYETGTRTGQFFNLSVSVPGDAALQGFTITGDDTNVALLGASAVGIGNFDTTAGDDLIVGSLGNNTTLGKVFFLSGHPYVLASQTGLTALPLSELGFRPSANGQPNGAAFAQGEMATIGNFGSGVFALGNVYDLPSANKPGTGDIAVQETQGNNFYVYTGDDNFQTRILVIPNGPGTILLGTSIASGRVNGDLDGDGFSELVAGASLDPTSGATPAVGELWYGGTAFAAELGTQSQLSTADASRLDPPAASNVVIRVAKFAGDIFKDGHPDLVIGGVVDPFSTPIDGEFTILY
jgi:hypothetical protein